jgi:hypothetical protein
MRIIIFFCNIFIGNIMNDALLLVAKSIAPALIKLLRTKALETETKIDDALVDTLEFILKKLKLI